MVESKQLFLTIFYYPVSIFLLEIALTLAFSSFFLLFFAHVFDFFLVEFAPILVVYIDFDLYESIKCHQWNSFVLLVHQHQYPSKDHFLCHYLRHLYFLSDRDVLLLQCHLHPHLNHHFLPQLILNHPYQFHRQSHPLPYHH